MFTSESTRASDIPQKKPALGCDCAVPWALTLSQSLGCTHQRPKHNKRSFTIWDTFNCCKGGHAFTMLLPDIYVTSITAFNTHLMGEKVQAAIICLTSAHG